jgi:hypothetical protein
MRPRSTTLTSLLLLAGLSTLVRSASALQAQELQPSEQLEIDGRATEPGWQRASWTSDFHQREPLDGAPPGERTKVAFLHDRDALYLFVEAEDHQPQSIEAALTRRDEDSPSDWVELWLAPSRDHRSGYRLAVNARGVQLDARLSEGGEVQSPE